MFPHNATSSHTVQTDDCNTGEDVHKRKYDHAHLHNTRNNYFAVMLRAVETVTHYVIKICIIQGGKIHIL